jgi:tRNA (cmo5U34)-methyltransferase
LSTSYDAWKTDEVVQAFLEGVRGGIPLAREQIDVMIRLVEANGSPVRSFADLGSGSGVLSLAILERYPDAAATLVDLSEPMIEAARDHLARYASNCRFVTADLSDADWVSLAADRAPFDLVVSGYAIHHLPDQRKSELYAEIFGLLRPGGLFLNTDHVKSPTPWIEGIFDDLLIDSLYDHHSRIGSGKTREQVAREYVHRPDKEANMLAPVEVQCEWLRRCGFEDVDCYFKILELAMFGGRRPR